MSIVKLSLSHLYPGQVWCLSVSIPDLCPLSHFSEAPWSETLTNKLPRNILKKGLDGVLVHNVHGEVIWLRIGEHR